MRTPSMTIEQAEAEIGQRGLVTVNSQNRKLVNKWLTAQGFPGMFAAGLSNTEMHLAYNQTDGEGLAKIRAKLARYQDDNGADESTPETALIEAPKPNGNGHDSDASALIEMMQRVLGRPAGCDESAVSALITRHIDQLKADLLGMVPVTRIELSLDGIVRELPQEHRHSQFELVLKYVAMGENVCLVGPAGSGKTTLAEQVFTALNIPFRSNGQMTGAHEVLGFVDGHGRYQTTAMRASFENGGGWLADEVDGSDPSVPCVLNAALSNGHMAFPDSPDPIKRHTDFRCIATANTWLLGADRVYVGRNQLDGAFNDRFIMINIGYDEKLERALAGNDKWVDRVQALRKAAQEEKARIIISPRASIRGAKALAAGIAWPDVEETVIWKGCETELRRRIEARAR